MNKPEPTRIEYPLTNATITYTDHHSNRVIQPVTGQVIVLNDYIDASNLHGPIWMPTLRSTKFEAQSSGAPIPERTSLKEYLTAKLNKFLDANLADLRLEAEQHLNDLADGYLHRANGEKARYQKR